MPSYCGLLNILSGNTLARDGNSYGQVPFVTHEFDLALA
jgi:hypothetical protein